MEFKPKNREWVKNAAIVFLAVLLVLTFFSNTIMNRTLPEVATAAVTDGSIVAKVRGSGTVKANGSHDVKATQTREIRSVMVKVGQEVKTGDPLFVLGAGDSAELEAAKENLRDLQYAYQKSAINMPTFNNTAEYRAVQTAERNRDAAQKAYDDAEKAYKYIQKELEDDPNFQQSKMDLEKAQNEFLAAQEKYMSIKASYEAKKIELASAVEEWQKKVNELTNIQPPTPTTPSETQEVDNDLPTDPNPSSEPSGNNNLASDGGSDPVGQGDIAQDTPEVSGGPTVCSAYLPDGSFVDITSVKPGRGYVLLANAETELTLEQAKIERDKAQAEYDEFVKSNEIVVENAKAALDKAKANYDNLLKYTEALYQELVPYRVAMEKAEASLFSAQNEYDIALANLSYTQASNDKTLASASIDLQQMAEKIKIAQEKVKELSGDAGDQIVANVNGTVTAIGCSAGDTVTKDTVVCTIEVPDMGHTLSFSVTNDQAQRLRVGDTATVSNYYWGKEIVATLTTIRTDPKNPQTNKELTFDLSGDVTSGSELTISVGQKSANYDVIIPNSAIRSDNNGKFVLAIQAKSSPLGNRYIAKRVSVEVLASDDNNSAVVADLGYGDYVITTSSSPVKSGDQVRMAESNG
ncbi:MAG: HlyD family efflux transporter periplasmic adaptor subunit [Candidatus Limivicinus sp.]|nr:HlyD family efflux transporter periplasmic adaptor subunit [Candidatus Limivicinus sp.]